MCSDSFRSLSDRLLVSKMNSNYTATSPQLKDPPDSLLLALPVLSVSRLWPIPPQLRPCVSPGRRTDDSIRLPVARCRRPNRNGPGSLHAPTGATASPHQVQGPAALPIIGERKQQLKAMAVIGEREQRLRESTGERERERERGQSNDFRWKRAAINLFNNSE